ncbi:MAG: hypothetical protein M3441_21185 [Chloroflexota bacterium]|nr:hypothetical protein [Chloroflexota bacterium]
MWFLVSPTSRVPVFFRALALATVCGVLFPKLRTKADATSGGIIALEFAGNLNKAETIKSAWVAEFGNLERARRSIFVDFPFILAYSTALGLACVLGHELYQSRKFGVGLGLPWIGRLFAWGATVAGLLDVTENLSLMVVLRGTKDEKWPQLAYACAALKFALLFAAICYAVPWLVLSILGWIANVLRSFGFLKA